MTDHKALKPTWLTINQNFVGRLGRWALLLQEFGFTIQYRKGQENKVTDALSRPNESSWEFQDEPQTQVPGPEDEQPACNQPTPHQDAHPAERLMHVYTDAAAAAADENEFEWDSIVSEEKEASLPSGDTELPDCDSTEEGAPNRELLTMNRNVIATSALQPAALQPLPPTTAAEPVEDQQPLVTREMRAWLDQVFNAATTTAEQQHAPKAPGFRNKPIIISLEGNIESGKSAALCNLVTALHDRWAVILEPVEKWQHLLQACYGGATGTPDNSHHLATALLKNTVLSSYLQAQDLPPAYNNWCMTLRVQRSSTCSAPSQAP